MEINLCGGVALQQTPHVHVDELILRLQSKFPTMVIDRDKGNAHVQDRLNRLIEMGAPEVVIASEQSDLGKVVFVLIQQAHWAGATVTSYMRSISPPLGDSVRLNVAGAEGPVAVEIAQEVAAALGMALFSPAPE